MLKHNLFASAAMLLAAGCASSTPQVALEATPAEIVMLTGEWQGEYQSLGTGRHGNIVFSLGAAGSSAVGEVLMVPLSYPPSLMPEEGMEHVRHPGPQVLFISFVHADGGAVTGRLAQYRDPECGHLVNTVFTGRLAEPGRIVGSFVTTGPWGHETHAGEWTVSRVRFPQ